MFFKPTKPEEKQTIALLKDCGNMLAAVNDCLLSCAVPNRVMYMYLKESAPYILDFVGLALTMR